MVRTGVRGRRGCGWWWRTNCSSVAQNSDSMFRSNIPTIDTPLLPCWTTRCSLQLPGPQPLEFYCYFRPKLFGSTQAQAHHSLQRPTTLLNIVTMFRRSLKYQKTAITGGEYFVRLGEGKLRTKGSPQVRPSLTSSLLTPPGGPPNDEDAHPPRITMAQVSPRTRKPWFFPFPDEQGPPPPCPPGRSYTSVACGPPRSNSPLSPSSSPPDLDDTANDYPPWGTVGSPRPSTRPALLAPDRTTTSPPSFTRLLEVFSPWDAPFYAQSQPSICNSRGRRYRASKLPPSGSHCLEHRHGVSHRSTRLVHQASSIYSPSPLKNAHENTRRPFT